MPDLQTRETQSSETQSSETQSRGATPEGVALGGDRRFERAAVFAIGFLVIAGIVAVQVRRSESDAQAPDLDSDDVLVVEIGGPRAAEMDPRGARSGNTGPSARRSHAPDAGDDVRTDQRGPVVHPGGAGDRADRSSNLSPTRGEGLRPGGRTRTIVVQSGETLGAIAQRELGSTKRLAEIVKLNGIENPDDVRAGTELLLPAE